MQSGVRMKWGDWIDPVRPLPHLFLFLDKYYIISELNHWFISVTTHLTSFIIYGRYNFWVHQRLCSDFSTLPFLLLNFKIPRMKGYLLVFHITNFVCRILQPHSHFASWRVWVPRVPSLVPAWVPTSVRC